MIALNSFAEQSVAVMGLGSSGMAAARALVAGGAHVFSWDDNPGARAVAQAEGIALSDLAGADWPDMALLVLSPGIPHEHPSPNQIAARARAAGCDIVCDVDLLGRAVPEARYVGITGTNGKSTVTAMIGHVFQSAGLAVQVGGNLGLPVCEMDQLGADGWYVLEMSSYQLERTFSITFEIAILVNISADHLDRHGGMDGYVAAKTAIFNGQTAQHTAVVGVDDERSRAVFETLSAAGHRRVVPISAAREIKGGVFVLDGILYDDTDGQHAAHSLTGITTLPGRHNWQNAAAAWAACRAAGLAPADILAGIRSYPGLPHRQDVVAVIDGVAWINDSKATNAEAAACALASYDNVYWIAGGQAKSGGIAPLAPLFDRVRHAYLIGEAADDFAETLAGTVPFTQAGDLATAVDAAARAAADAPAGAVVLLSPACASFDQFESFVARGRAFVDLVAALPGRRSGA